MKKSVLLLFFAGCVATGIFGIGRKIPMNRVNDLAIKAVKKMDYLSAFLVMICLY